MKSYRNLRYWNGTGEELRDEDIHVNEGLFSQIGNGKETEDLSGCFAIPGLIDAHVHLCLDPELKDPMKQTDAGPEAIKSDIRVRARAMLEAGITTARDLGGGEYLELDIRDEIDRGETPGPRLVCSGQPITSVGGHCHFWGGEAASCDDAIDVLKRQHERGVDLIKVMATGGNITAGSKPIDSQFDDDTIVEIVNVAAKHGYHVAAHCHGTNGIRQAAVAGVTTVEHCSWVGEAGWGKAIDDEVIAQLVANNVWVSPTINAGWGRFKDPGFVSMIHENYRKMKQAGVRLIASTDAGIPNVFHHHLPRALPIFAGFAELSATEVLRTATVDCAQAIGLGAITGKIEPGYSADFVVYDRDPLTDMSVLETPRLVVSRGIEYRVS